MVRVFNCCTINALAIFCLGIRLVLSFCVCEIKGEPAGAAL